MINDWTSYNENKCADHKLIIIQVKTKWRKETTVQVKQVGF